MDEKGGLVGQYDQVEPIYNCPVPVQDKAWTTSR